MHEKLGLMKRNVAANAALIFSNRRCDEQERQMGIMERCFAGIQGLADSGRRAMFPWSMG